MNLSKFLEKNIILLSFFMVILFISLTENKPMFLIAIPVISIFAYLKKKYPGHQVVPVGEQFKDLKELPTVETSRT